MKSRAVVGDAASATTFLHEIQEVDWRRYGQSGRSRGDLRTMRARLESQEVNILRGMLTAWEEAIDARRDGRGETDET